MIPRIVAGKLNKTSNFAPKFNTFQQNNQTAPTRPQHRCTASCNHSPKEMSFYDRCLHNNKEWVAAKLNKDKDYFTKLASIQTPKLLWIGCADSRIPPTDVTKMQPGDIFEHRNVANVVVHSDLNSMSVLQYAVEALKVEDIVVCGHYNCGGVRHAHSHQYSGLINKWLLHVKDVYDKYHKELETIQDMQKREDRLVELNVIEQCRHICQTSVVQRAWGDNPRVHGWVYDVRTGNLIDLNVKIHLHDVYKLDL